MKQIDFSPKVVTICELTAIAEINLVVPRRAVTKGAGEFVDDVCVCVLRKCVCADEVHPKTKIFLEK